MRLEITEGRKRLCDFFMMCFWVIPALYMHIEAQKCIPVSVQIEKKCKDKRKGDKRKGWKKSRKTAPTFSASAA